MNADLKPLVVFLLTFISSILSTPKVKAIPANQNQSGRVLAATTGAPRETAITALQRAPIVASQRQQKPSKTDNLEAASNAWSVFNNILLTVFNGALAVLAYRQWRSMDKQAEYMRKGLASTEKAAEAARAGAAVALDSLKMQRAYVIADDFDATDDGSLFTFQFAIKNVGATPAQLTESITCWLVCNELPEIPDYACANRVEQPRIRIAAGKAMRNQRSVDARERDRIQTALSTGGDERLHIFGRISYTDIWGDPHVTGWARTYRGRRPITNVAKFAYQSKSEYEYAD